MGDRNNFKLAICEYAKDQHISIAQLARKYKIHYPDLYFEMRKTGETQIQNVHFSAFIFIIFVVG